MSGLILDLDEAQLAESYRTVYEGILHPPETAADLYKFLTALTGEFIPFQSCCPDHKTPWDYIWHSYRVDLPKWQKDAPFGLVYMGPRGGLKTLSVSKLIVAELLLKKGCKTVGVGAIQPHSQVTYDYAQRYLSHPIIRDMKLIQKLTMKETHVKGEGSYKQAVATLAGANSKHCEKLRMEEMDAGWKPSILEEAKLMVQSPTSYRSHISFVSSRKFDDGMMDKLVETGESQKFEVIGSCYKDTSEPCPEERRGKNRAEYKVEDIFNPGEEVIVNAYEGCRHCPLLPSCRGDLANAHGIVKIDDHIKDFASLDIETWIYQKESRKAKATDSFFPEWIPEFQLGYFPYNPTIGWVDLSFDFTNGGADPTIIGVWQTDTNDNDYLIGEIGPFLKKTTKLQSTEAEQWLQKRGINRFRHMFGDCANPQAISDWNAENPKLWRIKPVRKIERREGWKIMRQRIRDAHGVRHLFVNRADCKLFPTEVKDVKRHRIDPMDIKDRQSDHSLDQARYRFVELRWHPTKEPGIRILDFDDDSPRRGGFPEIGAPKPDASKVSEDRQGGLNRLSADTE